MDRYEFWLKYGLDDIDDDDEEIEYKKEFMEDLDNLIKFYRDNPYLDD